VRVDRLPRGTDVVLTSRLPRFDPRGVAGRPERGAGFVETVRKNRAPLPVVMGADSKPLPFRAVERSAGETRGRRAGPAGGAQARPRVQNPRPGVRPGAPTVGPGRGAQRPGTSVQPRGRPGSPSREGARPQTGRREVPGAPNRPRGRETAPQRQQTAPPARDRNQSQGGHAAPPARAPEPPRDQARPEPRDRGRDNAPPKRESPRDNVRRPTAASDGAIERLFDGVRGERGRPRVEGPPRESSPRVPPRPEARPQRPERPPQAHPPTPRPQPKPEENNEDKGKGH